MEDNFDVTDPSSDKTVPYERFKEVNDEMKSLKNELETYKTKAETQGLSKQEQEAKEYLQKLVDERVQESASQREKEEAKELEDFQNELNTVLELNSSVDKEKFLDFLEKEADSYEVYTVKGAMAIYKKLNSTSEEAKESAKNDLLRKPNLPSSDPHGSPTYEDKGKSMYQIAEEAKKQV